jgi:hypothetical protein
MNLGAAQIPLHQSEKLEENPSPGRESLREQNQRFAPLIPSKPSSSQFSVIPNQPREEAEQRTHFFAQLVAANAATAVARKRENGWLIVLLSQICVFNLGWDC